MVKWKNPKRFLKILIRDYFRVILVFSTYHPKTGIFAIFEILLFSGFLVLQKKILTNFFLFYGIKCSLLYLFQEI